MFVEEKIEISDELFKYGFANGYIELFDKDGEPMFIGTGFIAALEFPYHITVNNDPDMEVIELKEGQSHALSGSYGPSQFYKDGELKFTVDDGMIAHMDGNRLIVNGQGVTTLRVIVAPYGGEKLITIRVNEADAIPIKPDERRSDPSRYYIIPLTGIDTDRAGQALR